ncbi:MAG: hypothetical protein D6706_10345 [Chloroflexi bacterium]|nr:MAG: hypothetical protein D6706_10345 [Chloroflexota bacterium]
MTKSTFDKLFTGSTPLKIVDTGAGKATFVVRLADAAAIEWVNARGGAWVNTANSILSDLCGRNTAVSFVLNGQAGPTSEPAAVVKANGSRPTHSTPTRSEIPQFIEDGEFRIIRRADNYPKARTAGFVAVPHYAIQFWRPFLGALPFDLYMIMNSYWYSVSHGQEEWPSLSELSMCLAIGDRATLTGRERGSDKQTGLLQILEAVGFFVYRSEGRGRGTKHIFDAFLDIDDQLPILTPAQVYGVRPGNPLYAELPEILRPLYRGFPPQLQRAHERFLKRWKQKTGIDVDEWMSIQDLTLVPPVVVEQA